MKYSKDDIMIHLNSLSAVMNVPLQNPLVKNLMEESYKIIRQLMGEGGEK